MGYLKLRNLKSVIDGTTASTTVNASTNGDSASGGGDGDESGGGGGTPAPTPPASDADKNAEVYAELIQFLDDRSLSLIFRDAPDDGKKALEILREYYMGKGKPRILTLWTELSLLTKGSGETVTDYIIRAEKAMSALRNAGETVSDSLLIAMVLKGLPSGYKPFEVVTTQRDEIMTFAEFKTSLRNYEDTENARTSRGESDSVKHFQNKHGKQNPVSGGRNSKTTGLGNGGNDNITV